jgi:hypothetical protein
MAEHHLLASASAVRLIVIGILSFEKWIIDIVSIRSSYSRKE